MKALGAVSMEAYRDREHDETLAKETGLLDCARKYLPDALHACVAPLGGVDSQPEHPLAQILGPMIHTAYHVRIAPERSYEIIMGHFHYDEDLNLWKLCPKLKERPDFQCLDVLSTDLAALLSLGSEEFERRFGGPFGAAKLWLGRHRPFTRRFSLLRITKP